MFQLSGQTPTFSAQQINGFLKRKSWVFADFLTGDPTRAKQELQKHVTKLVLTRKETPDGNVFEVSGDVSLFVEGKDDVVVTNSWERFAQHYIFRRFRCQAFSSTRGLKLRVTDSRTISGLRVFTAPFASLVSHSSID
jgi:hypothetical protein